MLEAVTVSSFLFHNGHGRSRSMDGAHTLSLMKEASFMLMRLSYPIENLTSSPLPFVVVSSDRKVG